ncbi:hypothetical protein [Pseudomonas sp. TMW 2.1634]|uniref:hypothetical protein n=1 Tax=Pseudomonas sp. TMW 2.1634 TaxID=1886807 RepID=UPI000E73F1BD|nr:hypothetical protein [Pseudomonas sp. TMW 2.1634]AOA06677.1 hypothetical protein BFC21_13075 [Pseudomonas sp. TMW 2.1634]
MAWTFKDRYKPNRMITVDDDVAERLKRLEDTFEAFRAHNALDVDARKQQLLDEGYEFARAMLMHTHISYCLGTYDCEEDVYFDYYCETVRKHLINVHPVFAMRKFAEFIAFIKNQNESIEACQFLKENVDKLPDDM